MINQTTRKNIYSCIETQMGPIPKGLKGIISKLLKEYAQSHNRCLTKMNNDLLIIVNRQNRTIDALKNRPVRPLHTTSNIKRELIS